MGGQAGSVVRPLVIGLVDGFASALVVRLVGWLLDALVSVLIRGSRLWVSWRSLLLLSLSCLSLSHSIVSLSSLCSSLRPEWWLSIRGIVDAFLSR
jgi:hypothetical protein